MLIPEEESFLRWLQHQQSPVPARVMREENAPCFTADRLKHLVKSGLVSQALGVDIETCETAGFYAITDEGRRALQELQQHRDQRAEEHKDQSRNRAVQITTAIIGATLGSLLTIFFQHSGQILQIFRDLTQ